MKLTGKAKEDFDLWLQKKSVNPNNTYVHQFYNYPFSMQWGVYVDFFDGKKIIVFVRPLESSETYWKIEMKKGKIEGYSGFCNTITEARKAAIEKANELYNA